MNNISVQGEAATVHNEALPHHQFLRFQIKFSQFSRIPKPSKLIPEILSQVFGRPTQKHGWKTLWVISLVMSIMNHNSKLYFCLQAYFFTSLTQEILFVSNECYGRRWEAIGIILENLHLLKCKNVIVSSCEEEEVEPRNQKGRQ